MNELEKNTPDDFWRKAFDEAAETPPPRVWDAIERRLDESEGPKILPLWDSGLALSRPFGWAVGVAAAVALLLVGWWAINTRSVNQPVAQLHPAESAENVAVRPLAPEKSATSTAAGSTDTEKVRADQSTDAVASVNKPVPHVTPAQTLASSEKKLTNKPSNESIAPGMATDNIAKANKPVNKTGGLSTQSMVATNLRRSSSSSVTTQLPPSILSAMHERISSENRIARMAAQTSAAYHDQVATSAATTAAYAAIFEQLTGRPLRLRSVGPIQRIVWFRPAELPMEPEVSKSQRKSREMWASASVMPGAFNPMVAVKSAQVSYANTMVASNQSAVTSRANFSVAYQAAAGVQLNDRWSVESGIGYLAGHSTVETPAQMTSSNYVGAVATQNVVTSNLYVDAIQHSLANKAASSSPQTAADLVANNSFYSQARYTSQTQEALANNYQYMQVPIQIGYQLRPRKRLSMALLGGLLTNIFVKNTVGNDVVITAKDGVYRPVSLAATMGARFRYRPSGKWSASLAGLYQPSLEFGTQTESQVQSRPTSTGMSFGVDYHF